MVAVVAAALGSFTAMASIVLTRSTAVLHAGEATAPTTTPPTNARVTSRPVSSSQRLEGRRGSGSGAGGG